MSIHHGVEWATLYHNATGAVKVVSEVLACHSVEDSGKDGTCANVTSVGLTKISVLLGTGDPCHTSKRNESNLLSWCNAMIIEAGKLVSHSSLDSGSGAMGEMYYADVGHYTAGTKVADVFDTEVAISCKVDRGCSCCLVLCFVCFS